MKRRIALVMTIIFLFAAALQLNVSSSSDLPEELENGGGWIVQLSSPLPFVLMEEGTEAPIQPLHEPEDLYLVTDTEFLEMLREEDMLAWAEPDMEVELFAEGESGGADPTRWPLDMLNTYRGDALGCFGQNIRVAVIDSGCSPHAEIAHALQPGHNYIDGSSDVTDNKGHGSFVAGLIAAADDGAGVSGTAPAAEIVPLKCFDNGFSTRVSTLTTAIYDAVDKYGCRVINMSFGLKSYSQALDTAITYVVDKGAVCVASAGNYGSTELYYPAALPNVIGVGSVDSDGNVSSFSQRNDSLTVTAPGRGVYGLTTDGGYTMKNGTSFSAPLISGLCARLLSADESLESRDIIQLLAASAEDLGDGGYDTVYGYGLADLEGAMDLLLGSREVFLSPFRVKDGTVFITLLNGGSGRLSGQCILTRYSEGLMKGICWEDISLSPGESITLSFADQSDTVKCSFWTDFSEITPLTPYRECEVSS